MMNPERLKYLFHRYMAGTITPAEKQELTLMGLAPEYQPEIERLLESFWHEVSLSNTMPADKGALILEKILAPSVRPLARPNNSVIRLYWKRAVAAASVILVAGIGYYAFFLEGTANNNKAQKTIAMHDVKAPAANRAVITLANGRTISLDSAANGLLARQGTTQLKKLGDGQVGYSGSSPTMLYNTLFNPRGSKVVDLALSDGSHVWLNAGSSITYPVSFAGKERKVTVTGEVYIKVARDHTHPFTASANGMDVQALGTEFNIDAYNDEEQTKATLIEGSVKVSAGGRQVLLHPGEQTRLAQGNVATPTPVNIEEVTGWKNGLFHFESAGLKTILREFARWYDIDVVYDGPVADRKFFGIVKRSNSLDKVLELLQDNNIQFRIDGRKLTVKQE